MMELKQENVIKALKCCTGARCKGASCPYRVWDRCIEKLSQDTLLLIEELVEENRRSRADVAREIFADIGKLTCTNIEDWKIYDELKKKYLEE